VGFLVRGDEGIKLVEHSRAGVAPDEFERLVLNRAINARSIGIALNPASR